MATSQALPVQSFQCGNGTALAMDVDVGLKGVGSLKCYRGVWIYNQHATANLLIDYRAPKASLSYRIPPGANVFIPIQDPQILFIRGQSLDVNYSWFAI